MRITKKFEGDNSLGKVVYKRLADEKAVREARAAVKSLEEEFLDRLDKTKSSSSQAVADRALLEELRESGASDLIELFCLGVQRQQESQLREDKSLFLRDSTPAMAGGDDVMEGVSSFKRRYEMESADGGGGGASTNLKRDLLLHLSRMQHLIQGQSIEFETASTPANDNMPPTKKFKSEETSDVANDPLTIESNYNTAISNLLSIQRMIMDNKHKLYDIEFNLAEVQLTSGESSLEMDTERRREVMASIQKEIEMLELQKREVEMEIEMKYKTVEKVQEQEEEVLVEVEEGQEQRV